MLTSTSRRAFCQAAGSFVGLGGWGFFAEAQSSVLAGGSPDFPWKAIADVARGYVEIESPDSVWPFERPETDLLKHSPRQVFLHYFTPFPLSFDNKPVADDYYSLQYLQRSGENGKFRRVGGYLRERPIGPGALSSSHWQAVNAMIDVFRADLVGADGFGVDLQQLDSGRYWDNATALFGAAQAAGTGFRILIEPDADILKAVSAEDLVKTLAILGRHPATYRIADDRILLAPFAPETQSPSYWLAVLDGLKQVGVPAAFLPVFNNLRANAQKFAPLCYGASQWGNRDPVSVDADNASDVWRGLSSGKTVWMEPIVPQDLRPKSSIFWESGNTELFLHCWMKAIRGNAQYAHLVTWNDYSEATEIGPSSGTQYLYYDLSAYFIAWFKLGRAPKIIRDAIFYSHRRQIFALDGALQAGDAPLRLLGRTPLQNKVEMVAMLTESATLEIHQGENVVKLDAPPGLAVCSAPARVGKPIFRIVRNGKLVLEKAGDWEILPQATTQDPLYVGGSSTRGFVVAGDWHQSVSK